MKNISFLYLKLLIVLFVIKSSFAFSQTPLVEYNFNNVASWDSPNYVDPTLSPQPTLKYWRPESNGTRTEIDPVTISSGRLAALQNNDYIELIINTRGKAGLTLSFDWYLSGSGFVGGATWDVKSSTNGGTNWQQVGSAEGTIWFLGPTDSGSLSRSLTGNTAVTPHLIVRIAATDWSIWASTNFFIDNLKITYGNPNVGVYTGRETSNIPEDISFESNVLIANNSDANYVYNTVFPTTAVNENSAVSNFRIRNVRGSAPLTVERIEIEGVNPDDFYISGLSGVNPVPVRNSATVDYSTTSRIFDVTFRPTADGIRTAEVVVYSNGGINEYRFKVVGTGASCNLETTDYAKNEITRAVTHTLIGDYTDADLIVGQSDNNPVNNFRIQLYPNGNHNLYHNTNMALFQRGVNAKVYTFGGDGLDIKSQKDISIEFRVAAFGTIESSSSSNGSGVNQNSTITLAIQKPDGSYSDELQLRGSSSNSRIRYTFPQGAQTLNGTYDGDNSPVTVNNTSSSLYGKFKLNLPSSEVTNIDNLKLRISVNANNANTIWIVDDVRVLAKTSVFKTWNGTAWSPSGRPTDKVKAVFNGTYNFTRSGDTNDLNICECEVTPAGNVTVATGKTLTVQGKITNNGVLTVNNDANLIQVQNGAINTGAIEVNRNSRMAKTHYTYWSSPVSGQSFRAFSPKTSASRFYEYNEANNQFATIVNLQQTFVPGKGYAIMAPNDFTTTIADYLGVYKGVPNNGEINFNLKYSGPGEFNDLASNRGFNLVGNPYPSNIDFAKLYNGNSDNIYNTAYFWTNVDANRPASTNGSGDDYTGNAYAIYNGTGGVPPSTTTGSSIVVSKNIKVGQGFIVVAKANNKDLKFVNNIRTNIQDNQFFSKSEDTEKDRFWLKLTTPQDNVNTILLGYIPKATNDFEFDYDSPLLSIGADSFYSILGTEKLGIQGRNYPLQQDDVVVLATKHYLAGDYTISLGNKEGIFNQQSIYLKDKELNTLTDLTKGDYVYYGEEGTFENRFEIVYKDSAVLNSQELTKSKFEIYKDGYDFVVKSDRAIKTIQLYDMAGRLALSVNNKTSRLHRINSSLLAKGVYVVRVVYEDASAQTKKLLNN